ncbi:MbtH family NRPS accessory protein [Marinobacter halodurans]|uniref:MbtH family NRPS accessory protein n=1 Tax=Marinobacter halodurans TaxID=2528979 RepID=A0ABY1ZDK6_9GAMM|nr:MbtH family NRPS accessory protein [Marinobacter halodurans]TBW47407.1 MbtH family NRPS accessory protein [Marinobacter halodurans]
MGNVQQEDFRDYTVVKNGEDQFSIWLAGKEVPSGWEEVGKKGSKAECLEYIKESWTDMTPRSVRNARSAQFKGAL